jgi:hypothetical protein
MCYVTAALAVVSAVGSAISIAQQNRAANDMADNANQAAARDQALISRRQTEINDKLTLDNLERARQANRDKGKVNVSAAEGGVMGNSVLRQLNDTLFQMEYDQDIYENAAVSDMAAAQDQRHAVRATQQGRVNQAKSMHTGPLMSGLQIGSSAYGGYWRGKSYETTEEDY